MDLEKILKRDGPLISQRDISKIQKADIPAFVQKYPEYERAYKTFRFIANVRICLPYAALVCVHPYNNVFRVFICVYVTLRCSGRRVESFTKPPENWLMQQDGRNVFTNTSVAYTLNANLTTVPDPKWPQYSSNSWSKQVTYILYP
jgi:hypothetical protein